MKENDMSTTSLAVQPSTTDRIKIQTSPTPDFLQECVALSNAIAQRAFGLFQQRGTGGHDWDDWFRAESELLRPMPIEMSESDEAYTIRAEVPGFAAKDLKVRVEPTSVSIHGKSEQKTEEKKGREIKYSEVHASELCRCIDLPTSVNSAKASAQLANGVLELILPKAVPQKSIEVKAA
jgi:HSP20 family protein